MVACPEDLVEFCLALGSVESSAALLWGLGLLVLLPMGLGPFVLGRVWEPARCWSSRCA